MLGRKLQDVTAPDRMRATALLPGTRLDAIRAHPIDP